MKMAAILPIKFHSERVPGKNFRDLCGRPLYQWILGTLLSLPELSRIVIDTDCPQVLSLPETPKIRILERPESLRGDHTSMNDIIEWDMAQEPADAYLQTHATNPLLTSDTISRGIRLWQTGADRYDSLFSVNRIQARVYWGDGSPINHKPGALLRTQDLPPVYEENSCMFLFTRASFQKNNSRVGQTPLLYETPREESVDIDEEADFLLAEKLLKQR